MPVEFSPPLDAISPIGQSTLPVGMATLGQLELYTQYVDIDDTVQRVIDLLVLKPDLPGVLVEKGGQVINMISREKCFEQLGRPYGIEVFTRRSVAIMLEHLPTNPLILDIDQRIDTAVQLALTREAENRYEPIIVRDGDANYSLINLHDLLLAQSRLFENANRMIQQQIQVVRAISSTLQLEEVLALILENMNAIIPFERAALMLRYGDRLEYAAGVGYPAETDPAAHLSDLDRHPLFRRILIEGKPIVVDDMAQNQGYTAPSGLTPTGVWLGLPLISSGKVNGLLSISRIYGHGFQSEELLLAGAFADQAAVALENARLYEESRRFNHELEMQVQRRTEDLQAANKRLTQLDQTKNELIFVMSNELWRPINSIGFNVHSLSADVDFRVRPKLRDRLDIITSEINRLQHVITNMIDVARLNQNAQSTVNLRVILNSQVDYFRKLLQHRNLKLSCESLDGLPLVKADPSEIQKMFYQLILNATQFTPDGGEVNVSGAFLLAEENPLSRPAVRITITDTGVGIAQDKLESIFMRPGQNESEPSSREGGLGLALVKGIVEGHNGRVYVESSGYDNKKLMGSAFHVLLPV